MYFWCIKVYHRPMFFLERGKKEKRNQWEGENLTIFKLGKWIGRKLYHDTQEQKVGTYNIIANTKKIQLLLYYPSHKNK